MPSSTNFGRLLISIALVPVTMREIPALAWAPTVATTSVLYESPKMVKAAKSMRETLIDTANELKQAGITITLSYKADVVATVGARASAGISRLVTGTKAIEINSLPKLVELGIYVL